MIYILATDAADASAYAMRVLGIPMRRLLADAKAIIAVAQLPGRFADGDRVKMTSAFESLIAEPRWNDGPPTRTQFSHMVMSRENARGIWGSAIRKGLRPEPAYDVPETLDRDSIERWLAEG